MPDKGKVENSVGYARRNYLVPLPRAATFEELNAQLEPRCRRRLRRSAAWSRRATIGDPAGPRTRRAFHDSAGARPTSRARRALAGSARCRWCAIATTDYSVPTRAYGHRAVLIRGYCRAAWRSSCGGGAASPATVRSYAREDFSSVDPLHYSGAARAQDRAPSTRPRRWRAGGLPDGVRRAAPLARGPHGQGQASASSSRCCGCWKSVRARGWSPPPCSARPSVARGTIGFDAVKHLVLCRLERRPPRLDLNVGCPHPAAAPRVATTAARSYLEPAERGARHEQTTPQLLARPPPRRRSSCRPFCASTTSWPASAPPRASTTPRYLLRLAELELIEFGSGACVERRIRAGPRLPGQREASTATTSAAPPSLNKALVLELALMRTSGPPRERHRPRQQPAPARPTSRWAQAWPPARRALSVGSTTAAALVHELLEARDEKRLLPPATPARRAARC